MQPFQSVPLGYSREEHGKGASLLPPFYLDVNSTFLVSDNHQQVDICTSYSALKNLFRRA